MKEPDSNIIMRRRSELDSERARFQAKPRPNYKVGGFAKTTFYESGQPSEHMWVKITGVMEDGLIGTLNNDPKYHKLIKNNDPVPLVRFEEIESYLPPKGDQ